MKISIKKITTSVAVSSLLWTISCRTTDTENNLTAGISPVSVSFLGTAYEAETEGLQASTGKSGIVAGTIQKQSVLIDPSNVLSVEYAPAKNVLKTTSGINGMAAIDGAPLQAGVKFRLLAYNGSSTTAESQSDFTVAAGGAITGNPLMLTNGANYTIVAYSYGSDYLPTITNNTQSIPYNNTPANQDLMYQKLTFTPNGGNGVNTITIKLRHVTTQITTTIDAASYGGGNITNIQNARITPHYTTSNLALASGTLTGPGVNTTNIMTDYNNPQVNGVPLVFPNLSAASLVQTANPILINANERGSFSADIALGSGPLKNVGLPNSFYIKPGYRRNLTIKLARCGANIKINGNPASNKNFMCHNLGADYTQNPDPSQANNVALLHGAKYMWGAKEESISMINDQPNGTGDLINNVDTSTNAWGTTSSQNNPCPSGYRIPTQDELQDLIDPSLNTSTVIGNWAPVGSPTNFGSFRTFTSRTNASYSITMPAAGWRQTGFNGSSQLNERGYKGYYWASDRGLLNTYSRLSFDDKPSNLSVNTIILAMPASSALSVRCIAD